MQTPSPLSHLSGNPDRGKRSRKWRGCGSSPGRREPSPALPPPRQTGRDNPRAGDSGRDPLSLRTLCRGGHGRTRSRRTGAGRAHPERRLRSRSLCQVRGKRRSLGTSGAGKRSGLPAGSRKREPGAAAGPTDSAQAASSALLMGESSAKPTPREGIKEVRSYRIFIKSGVVDRAVWGRAASPSL